MPECVEDKGQALPDARDFHPRGVYGVVPYSSQGRNAAPRTEAQFESALAIHRPDVVRFLLSLGSNEEQAEDEAQETILRAWRKRELFDPDRANFRAWIFKIATRARLARLKREWAAPPTTSLTTPEGKEFDAVDARAEDALKLIESRELPERAIALLATMTPRSARVLALLANGLTYAQIAERTGMKIGTVWSCASRARECALRELGTNDMRRVIDLLR